MKLVTYSNTGTREKNEDCFAQKKLPNGDQIFIVADGMGGYEAGEIAASTAVEAIIASLSRNPASILAAVGQANADIATKKKSLGIDEMGCTLAAVLLHEESVSIFWVGDSRVYLIRDNRILFETEDHSLINEIRKVRRLTPAQIRKYEHIVRRSLMGNPTDVVDVVERDVQHGDEVLICSDGIHKEVPLPILLEKLRNESVFSIENEKFSDNHTLVYFRL